MKKSILLILVLMSLCIANKRMYVYVNDTNAATGDTSALIRDIDSITFSRVYDTLYNSWLQDQEIETGSKQVSITSNDIFGETNSIIIIYESDVDLDFKATSTTHYDKNYGYPQLEYKDGVPSTNGVKDTIEILPSELPCFGFEFPVSGCDKFVFKERTSGIFKLHAIDLGTGISDTIVISDYTMHTHINSNIINHHLSKVDTCVFEEEVSSWISDKKWKYSEISESITFFSDSSIGLPVDIKYTQMILSPEVLKLEFIHDKFIDSFDSISIMYCSDVDVNFAIASTSPLYPETASWYQHILPLQATEGKFKTITIMKDNLINSSTTEKVPLEQCNEVVFMLKTDKYEEHGLHKIRVRSINFH